MKPQHVYLDTNAFRYFGQAFETALLADDLRAKMLISPLSAFEIFAQLASESAGDIVLRELHAILNWTNPRDSGLLPWPDAMLFWVWFHEPKPEDGFTQQMQDAFNMCLAANTVAAFKDTAEQHQKLMDTVKIEKAQEFKKMIDAAKTGKVKTFDMTSAWFVSIAKSVHADPGSKSATEIVSSLSAYHEFQQTALQRALTSPEYNPLSRKNQNDIIDAEQLIYLADPSLCMLTSDAGFKKKVINSEQATRIITAPQQDLVDAARAETVLRSIFL